MACPLLRVCWMLKDGEKLKIPPDMAAPHCPLVENYETREEVDERLTVDCIMAESIAFLRAIEAQRTETNKDCRALLAALIAMGYPGLAYILPDPYVI